MFVLVVLFVFLCFCVFVFLCVLWLPFFFSLFLVLSFDDGVLVTLFFVVFKRNAIQ